ncbi:MAG: hypothetical protein M1832_006040 [Thelocarpon impressellum]|nr:MAG: hypothetical protein M1832_006040 [Thelocarpon impressellum]
MISTVPGEADGYADLAPPPHGTGYSADGQLLFSGGPPHFATPDLPPDGQFSLSSSPSSAPLLLLREA